MIPSLRRSAVACVLTASAAFLLLTLSMPAPAQAAKRRVPQGFFGTVLEPITVDPARVSDATLDAQMGLMARSGVESLRVDFEWAAVEPQRDVFVSSVTDRIVLDAARHGMQLLPDLIGTPAWASSHPGSIYASRYAPTSTRLFADFATWLVRRYGPHGTLWKSFPSLRKRAVREWQIWNEQGLPVFWATTPWPRTYVQLLKAAYLAIHHADRGAKVVAGSVVAAGPNTQWAQMRSLYRAGAKRYFDLISVHPFTDGTIPVSQSVSRVVTIVRYVRDVMRQNHDGHKPVILTEMTWPAAVGFVNPHRLLGLETTPRGERLRLAAAYTYLATHIRQTGVTQVYWFDWASNFDANDPQSDVGYRFAGLNRFSNGNFVQQPALSTYAQIARRFEGCAKLSTGSCH